MSMFKMDPVKGVLWVCIMQLVVLIVCFLVLADINNKLKTRPEDVLKEVKQIQDKLENK